MLDAFSFTNETVRVASAIFVLMVSFFLTRVIAQMLKRTGEKIKLSRDVRKSAGWVINLAIYSVAAVLFLYILGFDVTTLLAGVGILALAIGFAAQQLLSNIIAGFIIIMEKPFKIGDLVSFDGKRGWVDGIGLRSTRIATYDHNVLVVPNSTLVNSTVLNSTSGMKEELVSVSLLLKDGTDVEKIAERFRKIPEAIPESIVDNSHPVETFITPVEKLGNQRYSIELLFWVKDSRSEKNVVGEFTTKAKKILEA